VSRAESSIFVLAILDWLNAPCDEIKAVFHHLSLDKWWRLRPRFDMSHEHEQNLLHNRSNCRYRDCPQTPRIVLGWF
jgi:hypothetical protein